jgi:arylsulfatase A-like enzyme
MFTGLLPSEHCTHNDHKRLDDRFTTIAELLRDAGYQTFLFSSNPHISAGARNFDQGFDQAERPFSPEWKDAAREHLRAKHGPDEPLRQGTHAWSIARSGPIAKRAALRWLQTLDRSRPYFVFLNYMEAHPPYRPSLAARQRLMSPDQAKDSYRATGSWEATWEYTFGLRELPPEQIQAKGATYDATLTELDELFYDLLQSLEAGGYLENTVVVLTADHGEQLGEHHMFDHQYSLFDTVLRVPLVISDPSRFEPGRDPRPVSNLDLFPTLLEIADLPIPAGTRGVSLLRPREQRVRIAEEPALTTIGIDLVRKRHRDWDPTSYQRRLRALVDARHKYIWASDGRHSLFDLASDPGEELDLIQRDPERASQLDRALAARVATFAPCELGAEVVSDDDPTERRLLEELGYIEGSPEQGRQRR